MAPWNGPKNNVKTRLKQLDEKVLNIRYKYDRTQSKSKFEMHALRNTPVGKRQFVRIPAETVLSKAMEIFLRGKPRVCAVRLQRYCERNGRLSK